MIWSMVAFIAWQEILQITLCLFFNIVLKKSFLFTKQTSHQFQSFHDVADIIRNRTRSHVRSSVRLYFKPNAILALTMLKGWYIFQINQHCDHSFEFRIFTLWLIFVSLWSFCVFEVILRLFLVFFVTGHSLSLCCHISSCCSFVYLWLLIFFGHFSSLYSMLQTVINITGHYQIMAEIKLLAFKLLFLNL